jgi:CRP/FNR family transcriptional regulator
MILTKFLQASQHTKVEKGEVIDTTEHIGRFYLVDKGYIKRYLITNSGNIDIQSFYGPGYFFSLTTAFSGFFGKDAIYSGPEVYYYEAMTDADLCYIDIDQVVELTKTNPLLYREMLALCARRIEANIWQIENRSLRNFHRRVAHELCYFAEAFGEKKGQGVKLKIPLTQQDLADTLSTTRETISISMSELKKKGLVKAGRYMFIPNQKKLQDEAFLGG